MIGLTPHQRELLAFLKSYIGQRGFAPTTDEMRVAVGLQSKSGIVRLLNGLEERGAIRRIPNRARAIELLGEGGAEFHLKALVHQIFARGGAMPHDHVSIAARDFMARESVRAPRALGEARP